MALNDLAQDFWFHHSHWKLSLSPPPLSCMNFLMGSMCMEQSILFSSPSQTAASPHAHGDFLLLFSLYRPKEHKKVGWIYFQEVYRQTGKRKRGSRKDFQECFLFPYQQFIRLIREQTVLLSTLLTHTIYTKTPNFRVMDEISISSDSREQPILFCFNCYLNR